ncbi:hypothetical protein [Mariniphaga sediminis]|uniref:hypothetical protein n=1 Tax=Mariniphaga sediminis TaxID=1628158 RepID=UPI00356B4A73
MAAEKYAYGIKSVKFGTPTGTNSMPGTLNQWAQTVAGSLTLSEDEAQTKDFNVEEATTPVKSIVTDVGALTANWRAYDLSPALLAVVKGGTATTPAAPADHTYDGPVSVVAKDLALEITTTNDIVFKVYNAAVIARFDGGVGRENLLEVEVRASAQDPGDGSSPYQFKFPNPA